MNDAQKSALQTRLRAKMKQAGFTMKSLSLAAGKNETYVRDILEGRVKNPSYSSIAQLAEQLGCPVDELMGGDGGMEEKRLRQGFRHGITSAPVPNDMLVSATLLAREVLEEYPAVKERNDVVRDVAVAACDIARGQETEALTKDLLRYLIEVRLSKIK